MGRRGSLEAYNAQYFWTSYVGYDDPYRGISVFDKSLLDAHYWLRMQGSGMGKFAAFLPGRILYSQIHFYLENIQ